MRLSDLAEISSHRLIASKNCLSNIVGHPKNTLFSTKKRLKFLWNCTHIGVF